MASAFIAKSEEILLKWQKSRWADKWYDEYGIEPIEKVKSEIPDDEALGGLLRDHIQAIKYEDEKIAEVRNEEFWIIQIAAMRALREEAIRISNLHELKMKEIRE